MRVSLACLIGLIAMPGSASASESESGDASKSVVVLEPGDSDEQLWLEKAPAGTHFDAHGVRIYGGDSDRYRIPPRFCLLTDRRRDPDSGIGYPAFQKLERWELSNAECYPVQVRDLESPSLSGITVIGVQSRALPWRVMKAMWDGDAVVVRHCTGDAAITDTYFENVEDGFGPQVHLRSWSLRNAYMRYIRDDAIENDDLISGEIVNCLIDGCFVFLSHRPDEDQKSEVVTTIRDCVVHVQAQPHDGVEGRAWRNQYIREGEDGIGRSPGMLFKWSHGGGSVVVKDCVFRVDDLAFSGPGDMGFPPGDYENVTLVWLGPGTYPRPLPRGVTLTRDVEIWEKARADWIQRMSSDHPAAGAVRQPATHPNLSTENAP